MFIIRGVDGSKETRKICIQCYKIKSISEYQKSGGSTKDGYRPECKSCSHLRYKHKKDLSELGL